ncbi:MAG: TM1812 family CRISPR-associated protein [Oscillospiraceae bacterium]
MKNFICTIPQQPSQSLKKTKYANPCENPALECPEAVSFPILVLIRNTVKQGEKIRITAVKPEHKNCDSNAETFVNELEALKNEIGIEYTLDMVSTPFSETIDTHLDLFGKLIDYVHDDDMIYADITFGTKPIPMLILMTLTYAYKFKKNASVENIVYGQYNHDTDVSSLYDVSALFYMNSTINTMDETSDPEKFIKAMLEL